MTDLAIVLSYPDGDLTVRNPVPGLTVVYRFGYLLPPGDLWRLARTSRDIAIAINPTASAVTTLYRVLGPEYAQEVLRPSN